MKKTLFVVMALAFIFTACKKDEPETLAGTTWTTKVEIPHEVDGEISSVERTIEMRFETGSEGKVVLPELRNEQYQFEEFVIPFVYTYSKGKGTAVYNVEKNETGDFTVIKDKLNITVKTSSLPIPLVLTFTKKK